MWYIRKQIDEHCVVEAEMPSREAAEAYCREHPDYEFFWKCF